MSDACSGLLANSGPAPPPPPPPPAVGQVPALRINTASELGARRPAGPQTPGGGGDLGYEPPAAIQNAMMTKDKKPFTYTPGMGGKLDLSQIRSPRMARRVAKNANDEGIEGPPKVLDQDVVRSPGTQPPPSMYSQPQVAVPVFPQGGGAGQVNLRNSCLPRNPVERPAMRVETTRAVAPPSSNEQTPTPPTSPTQVTLAKAPTPWMQKQVQKQEELPEWAKRPAASNNNAANRSPPEPESPQRQAVFANSPNAANSALHQQPRAPMRPVPVQQPQPNVPMRIEDRPSVFTAINEPGHHQFANSNPHHMSRWGNPMGQSGYQQPSSPQAAGAAYIVPVQLADQNNHYNQSQTQYRNAPDNRNAQRSYAPMPANQQPEPGPLQSQSFRVLQKITDTYNPDQPDGEQLRKLQLTEDDRYLMNKFKEQVDGDQYLHQEEDPRYRGAAIPSRAFRYLQTMTDSADAPNSTSRPVNSVPKKPNRHSNTFEEVPMQPYIPASQQQVQEPKKYTGGAIPSRSFRILQQMTTPESVAIEVPQESRRDDSTSELFDQQGVYNAAIIPHPPTPAPLACPLYWDPQIGRWTYYPYPIYETAHHHASACYSHCLCHSHCHCCAGGAAAAAEAKIQYPPHNNITASACTSDCNAIACDGNLYARNSALYLGSPWRCDSSATTDRSDSYVDDEGRPAAPVSSTPSPLLDSPSFLDDNRGESEGKRENRSPVSEGCNDDDNDNDNDNEDNDEEEEQDVDTENSSDSSCDSESFLAYSTGLNPLNRQREEASTRENDQRQANESDEEDSDSTDCEKVSQFEEDGSCTDKNEENEMSSDDDDDEQEDGNEEEDDNNTTVSVSLPLRFKFSVSDKDEDVTTVIVGDSIVTENVETRVDFTLKRVASREISEEDTPQMAAPTFVVTASAQQTNETTDSTSPKDAKECKDLLCVRNNSKEEITDDEDSGVTSDVSRIISEADTDSECCQSAVIEHDDPPQPPVVRRFGKNKKYERTQTHSRLFKLLSDEQLLLSSTNVQSTARVANDQPGEIPRDSLPPRPKSLDCEALLRRDQMDNPYYQTWNRPAYSALPKPQIYPRLNVYCPRTNSAKNIPRIVALKSQQMQSCTKSSQGKATTMPSNIPTPIRLNKRC